MAFILADRVKETTITTGTSNLSLGGAFGGFRTFSNAIGDGNSTYYGIETSDGDYEVGIGTYTSASNTLSRDTVISSSNSGSKLSLTGVSTVFVTQPGTKALFVNPDSYASGVGFTGYAFPDGTVQATSATDGAAPAKLRRSNAGVFFQYFVDNGNDRTVALHLENEELTPQWKMGLKNSPSSQTEAPSYGYVFGENGSAGAYADANNAIYINTNNGFWVVHESASVFNVDKSDGSIFKNGTASTPTLTVRGAAAQSAKLQQWETSAESVVASVDNAGKFICQTLQFGDGTSQTKAADLFQGNNVSLLTNDAGYITTHPNISAATSVDNSSPNFIQDITLDSNGHVVGITSAASYNHWRLSDDSTGPFNISDNEELKIAGGDNVTTSYDGTYKTLTITATDTNTTYTAGNGLVLAGTEFSSPDVATASGALRQDITSNTAAVSASGYKISGVLQAQLSNRSNWDTAYGWGNHASAGYLTSYTETNNLSSAVTWANVPNANITESSVTQHQAALSITESQISDFGSYLTSQTSHADVVVDGDFGSEGLMKRGGSAGSYSIVTDNSSNWNTAHGWGNHASAGYAPLANPTFTGTPAAPTASAATNTTQIATTAFVRTEISNLVDSAPGALDTLNELAAAINDDASFSTTVTNSIATKIGNVVEDTSPQLGGDLDANGNDIDMGTNTITDTKVGQWDTAYGWGDHSSAGYLTAHPNISAASSSDNADRTYIQNITLDSNGHVTAIATATETVTDTTYSEATSSSAGLMSTAHHDKLDGIEASADLTDATNVTAAGALMDSEVTNLAQVKAFDSSDYATAAQGTKADSAQQPPSEGAFVDGDKTKLDGIEASADVTDGTNVAAAGALMDSEVTNLSQVKAFDSSDYATAAQGIKADSAQQPPSEGAFVDGDKTKLDNSTNVTLAGSLDYITISDQEITRNAIDLAADVTGTLPASAVQDKFLLNDADDTTSGKITAAGYAISAVITEGTTSRTLSDSDNGKVIVCTNVSATTITVPASLATGFAVTVIQSGAGQITFSTSGGTTINNRQSHTKTAGQHARVGLVWTDDDIYNFGGDTAS